MKHLHNVMSGLLSLLVVGVLTMVIILVFSGHENGLQPANFQSPIQTVMPSRPASTPRVHPELPTATPFGYVPVYVGTPPTSTPRPGATVMPDRSTPTPTSTPMPVADLAEGVPDKDKRVCIIRRSDGKYEQYIIPTSRWADRRQLANLGLQDAIVAAYPSKPIQSTPWIPSPTPVMPTSTAFISPLPTPTSTAQP